MRFTSSGTGWPAREEHKCVYVCVCVCTHAYARAVIRVCFSCSALGTEEGRLQGNNHRGSGVWRQSLGLSRIHPRGRSPGRTQMCWAYAVIGKAHARGLVLNEQHEEGCGKWRFKFKFNLLSRFKFIL